jgi:hypothetical protein
VGKNTMGNLIDNKIIENEMATDQQLWPKIEKEEPTTAEYLFAVAVIFLLLGFIAIFLASLAPKPAEAKLGDYAGNTSTEKYLNTNDEIFKRLHDLEVATDQLQQQNKALEAKIGAVGAPQVQTIVKETQTQIVVQDEARMVAVEKRLSALEQVVNFLQKSVLDAVNKTSGLITKLLNFWGK